MTDSALHVSDPHTSAAPVYEDESGFAYYLKRFTIGAAKSFFSTFRSMPISIKVSTLWLLAISFGALFASWLPIQDPVCQLNLPLPCTEGKTAVKWEGPSMEHFLGTDTLVRDTFSRIVYGAQVSLGVVVGAVGIGMSVGGISGALVGFVRGKTESVVMAIIDIILAFPPLVLLLALASSVENRTIWFVAGIIGVLSIPQYTRVARANALAVSRREFVMAAEAMGTKRTTILFKEVLPNVLPILLAYAMVVAARVIVVEGALAFLNLSVPLPKPSWGSMINESRADIKQTLLPTLWPSLALIFTVLSLNMVGDWLQRRGAGRASAL